MDSFDSYFSSRPILKQLTDLNFNCRELIKVMSSLLPVWEVSPIEL